MRTTSRLQEHDGGFGCIFSAVFLFLLLHVHSPSADTNTLMTNSGGGGGAAETQTNEVSESNRSAAERKVKLQETEMEAQHNGRLGARHLSKIKEESDSTEHSTCYLPPIVQKPLTGAAGKPGVVQFPAQFQAQVQVQVRAQARARELRRQSEPASVAQYEQRRKVEDSRSLLDELSRIEAELRETLRLDMERQREAEFLRQQENKLLWKNLCYLSLSQRVAKPWVSSYFRKFPMHIYCLPVQAVNHKGRRRGLKKRR